MTVYESGLGVWVGGKTVSEIYYIIADFNGRIILSIFYVADHNVDIII